MITIRLRWQYVLIVLVLAGFMALGSSSPAAHSPMEAPAAQAGAAAPVLPAFEVGFHGLDPNAEAVALPGDIKWSGSPSSPEQVAILYGDPDKAGALYVELIKWHPTNHTSRPHYHANDRLVTVISGTWWKGTGTKYDLSSTVPIPPGSFVIDKAMGIHYDGAKDQEVVLELVGIGPAASIPAEVK